MTQDAPRLPHGGLRGIGESIGVVLRFARGNRRLAALLLSKTTFGVGTGVIVMLAVFGGTCFGPGTPASASCSRRAAWGR